MAETSLALDMDYPRPQLVISDGETLTPQTRALIRHVFHTDPVDVYGLVELSNFAWQCEMRQGYHVSADSHIVELVATTKGTGNIIVTALGMWAMPFIRYDTGDVGELQAEPCSCGRNSPVLSGIYGRAIDSILLPDGRKLFWPFFHEILGTYSEIKQWRVIQTDLSNLRVEFIVATESSTLDERLGQDLRQVLPCDMTINLTQVKEIPTQPGGKSRMVISSLSSSTF